MDCWDIVKAFYTEVLEINIHITPPKHHLEIEESAPMISSYLGQVEKIATSECKFGDILLLRIFGIPAHLGIYLNSTQIIHTQKRVGCAIDRLSRWERLIEGCYRFKG